jgi:hypothetical protein
MKPRKQITKGVRIMASKRTLTGKGKRKVTMKQFKTNLYSVHIPDSWLIKKSDDKLPPAPGTPWECCESDFVFAPEDDSFIFEITAKRYVNKEIAQADIRRLYDHYESEEPFPDKGDEDLLGFTVCNSSCENCHKIWYLGNEDTFFVIHYVAKAAGLTCQNQDLKNQISQVIQSLRKEE